MDPHIQRAHCIAQYSEPLGRWVYIAGYRGAPPCERATAWRADAERPTALHLAHPVADPNNDDPLNQAAAALWANQDEFAKMVDATYAKGGSSSS